MNLNRLEHPKLHKIKEKYFQFATFEQFENKLINLSIIDSKGEIFIYLRYLKPQNYLILKMFILPKEIFP